MKLFSKKQEEYMNWDEYHDHIEKISLYAWQQATRKQSLKNALASA